jgi:ribosomal protein L37AE/L43A
METQEHHHVIEIAPSGRAKCRACGRSIAKGELRLGEKLPNPFADGEMTIWLHLQCGAYARPEVLLYAVEASPQIQIDGRDRLVADADESVAHLRLRRISGVERASTGRSACRQCKEMIAKGDWRIKLLFYEDGRFNPSGFSHVSCSNEYLGTTDIMSRLKHYSPELSESDFAEIEAALG